MTNLAAARNWAFISRRTRPDTAPSAPPRRTALSQPSEPTRPGTGSLILPPANVSAVTLTPPDITSTPTLTRHTELTASHPVVRLTRRQSAIGTLRIDGATAIGWETTDRWHGVSLTNSELVAGPEHANRHLIERTDPTTVLVNARHVRELRRLIIAGNPDTGITLTTTGGTRASCTGTMYLHRLGNILEVRAEPATKDIGSDYGI